MRARTRRAAGRAGVVAALAIVAACAGTARPTLAPGTPPAVAAPLLRMPAPDAVAEAAATDALLAASDADLRYLCGMVGYPGTDGDALARYAIAALVARAGVAGHEAEQQRLESLFDAAMLAATDPQVRSFFAAQLQMVGSTRSVESLATLLADASTADAAIAALTAIGGDSAMAALREGLQAAAGAHRAAIILSLGRLGDVTASPQIVVALRDADPGVRLAALRSLAEIGPPAAADPMRDAAMAFAGADRARALAELIRYAARMKQDGEDDLAVALLEPLAADDNPAVRRAAETALAR